MRGYLRDLLRGYALEASAVERVNGCRFRVNREAVIDYAVGRPLVLFVDGKAIPAVVHQVSYNTTDSKTYITTNALFSGVPTVYRDTSLAYAPGVDRDTALLMHFDGASLNIDSSLNTYTITTVGSPTAGTSSPAPKFGSKRAVMTGSSGFYCTSMPMMSGAWTWEAWIYGQTASILGGGGWDWTGGNPQRFYFGIDGSFRPYIYIYVPCQSINDTFTSAHVLVANQWNHIVFCREGNATGKMYALANGVGGLIGTRQMPGVYGGDLMGILCTRDAADGSIDNCAANGLKVDEIRISTACRYTSNFTVPTLPFGPDAQ